MPACQGAAVTPLEAKERTVGALVSEPQSAELDPRWRLVAARDQAADDTFVYSVRTTGVYCRPSCAARRSRRGSA